MIDFKKAKINKKILILEDETDIADLLANRLEKDGYQAIIAHNGLEGLEALKEGPVDLIILDLNMPTMSGIEFYNQLCQRYKKPPCSVLIVTGRAEMEELFRDVKVDGFIVKPFTYERLNKELEMILEKEYRKKIDATSR